MSWKVVRLNGAYVCHGPNDSGYSPALRIGEALTIEELEPIAPAPTPEQLEQLCRDQFDSDKLFRAKCLSDLAFRLGKSPSALTAAEVTAERNRIAAIYRNL